MAILNKEATLNQGEETELFSARFMNFRLTLTGASGEFQTVPMKVRRRFAGSGFSEQSEIVLRVVETIFGATVVATAPQGVATLDIVYVVRTRGDA
jgi:hypothetical protein